MIRFCLSLCLMAMLSGCTPLITRPAQSVAHTVSQDTSTVDRSRADCPVTQPPQPAFTPPAPYAAQIGFGRSWYGTPELWTAIPDNGEWNHLPHNPDGYTQKVFWWRDGYFWKDEPEPALRVTGRRLDGDAPPLNVSRATNAFAPEIQSAMLVGVDFPTLGCWEITGVYSNTELSFVVWVAP